MRNQEIKIVWNGAHSAREERVASIAQGGVILVAWADFRYLDLTINWLHHMHLLKITSYMVGAWDDELLKALVDRGERNAFALDVSLQNGGLGRGTTHTFNQVPVHLVTTIIKMGFDIVLSDIDTAWLKDPFPYLARFPEADVLVATSALTNTSNDDGLENYTEAGGGCNTGIVLIRKRADAFAQEWKSIVSKDIGVGEQKAFHDLLRPGSGTQQVRTDRLLRGFGGTLLVGVLPVALFANGHTFFVRGLAAAMGLEPYVAHNNFQFSDIYGKRHRFRETKLWSLDPPEYYDPPGGFLSFDIRVGQQVEGGGHLLLMDIGKPIKMEDYDIDFSLVHAQLAQLRNALALSLILNRTLILPNLTSGAESWWHGLDRQGEARSTPADFILDLECMARPGGIPFRESSFLENPKIPDSVQKSKLQISMCKEGETCTSPNSFMSETTSLHLNHGLKDSEMIAVFKGFTSKAFMLQRFSATKILHFQELTSGFDSFFNSPEDAIRFDSLIETYTSLWCCGGTVDKQRRESQLLNKWIQILGT